MVTNTSASLTEQPAQTCNWELTPLSTKSTRTFVTSTGHKVIAIILEERDSSHISVHVTDDTAYVTMGFASFVGDNHRQEYEDYLGNLISGSGLEFVCRHFDALCNSLGNKHNT